jgi:hypothetical protein
MNLKLDSHVDADGRVWLQLMNQDGDPVVMMVCPLQVWPEFRVGMGIVEAKLIADGLNVTWKR